MAIRKTSANHIAEAILHINTRICVIILVKALGQLYDNAVCLECALYPSVVFHRQERVLHVNGLSVVGKHDFAFVCQTLVAEGGIGRLAVGVITIVDAVARAGIGLQLSLRLPVDDIRSAHVHFGAPLAITCPFAVFAIFVCPNNGWTSTVERIIVLSFNRNGTASVLNVDGVAFHLIVYRCDL